MSYITDKNSSEQGIIDTLAYNEVLDFYIWLDDTKPTTKRWTSVENEEDFKVLINIYIVARALKSEEYPIDITFSVNKNCKEIYMNCLAMLKESGIVDEHFFFTLHNNASEEDNISAWIKQQGWTLF